MNLLHRAPSENGRISVGQERKAAPFPTLTSGFVPITGLALILVSGCSSRANRQSDGPDGPALHCAATYDQQVQLVSSRCDRISNDSGTATCGGYLVVVERPLVPDPGGECFFDANTRALVAYQYCGDTGSCQSTGVPVDSNCSPGAVIVSGGFQRLCSSDGGLAVDQAGSQF